MILFKNLFKYKSSFFSLLPFFLVIIVMMGCNNDNPISDDTNSIELSNEIETSRVFDGRDSVATGIEGLTATQANSLVITEFVRIQDVVIRDGEKGIFFVEITDPENLDPSTLLFESRENNPILDSNGEQVTWGEFSNAEAAVVVKCTTQGTHTVTHLTELIPNGIYSLWIDLFRPGTRDQIGRIKYSNKGNVVRSSNTGEGQISGLVKPQALGDVKISNCMLNDIEAGKYDWRMTGIYHIDGTPGINEVNDIGTFVEQTGSTFDSDSPPIVE